MDDTQAPSARASKGRGARAHLRPVDGEPAHTLIPRHRSELEASGLDEVTIERSGLYSVTTSAAVAEILGWQWRGGGGLVLPFTDYDSRRVTLRRVKPDKPRQRRGKPAKYEQPAGAPAQPYFGPATIAAQRLGVLTDPLVWTEGEKKTLVLDQLGFAAIGLTGVFNFHDAAAWRDGDGLRWGAALRKYAERFFAGRAHVIAYDADAWRNEQVMLAARRLAGLLLHTGASTVQLARVPALPDRPKAGIDDVFVELGELEVRTLLGTAELVHEGGAVEPIEPQDPLVRLASLRWLRGAELDGDLRLPPRYDVRRDTSLWLEGDADKPDAPATEQMRGVVIPCGLYDHATEPEQRVEIAFRNREQWQRALVDRKDLRDTRRALAELPAPVQIDTNNARDVVRWLGEYMRHNERRLPHKRFVTQCGWHYLDGERCFMLDKPVSSHGDASRLVPDTIGDKNELVRALTPGGVAEEHLAVLREAFETSPICALAILTALAAPLLDPLAAPNFALNLYGDSSRGKSSMLKIAASVFGSPRNERWLASWNGTDVAIELRAEAFNGLPLCFDEVGAGDMRAMQRAIYTLVNGVGRARGTKQVKLRHTATFRNTTLSAGEQEVISEDANTGAQVRVLQARVTGFGDLDAAGVDALREAVEQHYGHAGRRWIEALVAVEDWTPYRDMFTKAKAWFRERAEGSLMQRQAVYWALLAVAECMAASWLELGDARGNTVRDLFTAGAHQRAILTASERAIASVSEWIASEPHAFPELELSPSGALRTNLAPHVRRVHGVLHGEWVYLLPSELRARLDSVGLSAPEIIASWLDAGWLAVDAGRRTKKVRWDGHNQNVYCVSAAALGIDG